MEHKQSASANYHSQALVRGLRIMEIIAQNSVHTTLSELHDISGLPKSTLVRLLSALTEANFLDRVDDRPAYRLGHKVAGLSAAYLKALDIGELVGQRLTEIAEQTRQTANLGVLDGAEVLHVAVGNPQRVLRFDTAVGDRALAYRTALGKVLLAALQPDQLPHHLPNRWDTTGTRAASNLDELQEELRRTQRAGYAVDEQEFAEGLTCIAVPLLASGVTVAAMSVSGPTGEFTSANRRAWTKLLHRTAREFDNDPTISGALQAAGRQRT